MRFLVVVKQKKNVDTFLDTIRALIGRGHAVTLAVQERHDTRVEQLAADLVSPGFSLVPGPMVRTDEWAETAPLLRSLGDCLHYRQPPLQGAQKLQARTIDKLREELRLRVDGRDAADVLREVPLQQIERLRAILGLAEQHLPTDPLYDAFLREQQPDVLLLSPVVHFGSAQADLVASARRLRIPVGMLLFSWDNLSTKGRLHRSPDWMFVWNERQRVEAGQLHGFPEDRVVVVGAPRFDSFFALRRQMSAEEFLAPLGLDPPAPTLLYVCSSPFVSAEELPFVRRWLAALRGAPGAARRANVIVRPHPDIALLPAEAPVEQFRWPAAKGMQGLVSRPFDDAHALVLRTSDRAMQGLYECIAHSAAVVGLNTSAELEAAIVGKPVYTVLAGDSDADGQASTLHFHYLLEPHGGFVRGAGSLDEHIAQLDAEVALPSDGAAIRRFVGEFLRPHGIERPVAALLAEAIERTFAAAGAAPKATDAARLDPQPDSGDEGDEESANADAAPVPVEARPSIALEVARTGARVQVHVRQDEKPPRVDKIIARWILEHVGIGDVLYDLAAGRGLYAVIAAKQRGATVVAFEPGYAAFKDLCDNLLLNGCDGAVAALPMALADFEGLGSMKFALGEPGESWHAVNAERWKPRRPAGDARPLVQPVCAITLDRAIERYELPAVNHMRVSLSSVGAVLAGAAGALSAPSLKTVFVTMLESDRPAVTERLAGSGFREVKAKALRRERVHALFARPG
jgi:FkbM family methyltransferase